MGEDKILQHFCDNPDDVATYIGLLAELFYADEITPEVLTNAFAEGRQNRVSPRITQQIRKQLGLEALEETNKPDWKLTGF
jgi:hypothetical protein